MCCFALLLSHVTYLATIVHCLKVPFDWHFHPPSFFAAISQELGESKFPTTIKDFFFFFLGYVVLS
jgi:hypothetical protein